jgi:hypothetical protein
MPDAKRTRIARALLVTGHPLPTLDTLRENRSEEYERAIARVRAGLGLPTQQPATQVRAADTPADSAGQDVPRPEAADPEAGGPESSGS